MKLESFLLLLNMGVMPGKNPTNSSRAAVTKHDTAPPPRLQALLEAAEEVFLVKGYHAATMSDVAKAAGMSKKTVYELVESKAKLFAALLSHHQSMLKFPVTEPGWTIHDILYANLLCLARFLLSASQIALLRLIMAEYTHSPDFGRIFLQNRVKKAKTKLESCLLDLAIGHGNSPAEAKEMAAMLFGMAIGEFHINVLMGSRTPPSKQVLEARVRKAVNIFIAGCKTGTVVTLPPPSCGNTRHGEQV